MKRIFSLLITVSLILSCVVPAFAEENVYTVLYSGEVQTLNYLVTANTNDQRVGANTIDTLVEYDNFGELKESLATEWAYDEENLTWTFKIREGQKWIDCNGNVVADVTAQDFVDAMKYMLTPENESGTVQNLFDVIANAKEYYNALAGEEGYEAISFDEVGVKATDEHTLVYTLAKPVPYFLSMLTYVVFMPAYGPLLEETGKLFATTKETMYYNGAFYLSSYEPQVEMIYRKNDLNWDAEHVYIDTIHRIFNAEASTIGPEMAKRGEIDYTSLNANIVDSWLSDANTASMVSMERPSIDYSYFYLFNFNVKPLNGDFYRSEELTGYSIDEKYEPWNWEIAVNNEAFRQSIRHAISRISTMYVDTGDSVDPNSFLENTITPAGFAVDNATGIDYTQQAIFTGINDTDSFDVALAQSYKAKAMEELGDSVSYPVKILVRYNPSVTNAAEKSVILEQQLEAVLGSDYIDVIVEAGPSENFITLVRRSSDYMIMLSNWGADYADPETWTDPFYQEKLSDGSYHRGMRYSYFAYAITDGMESADTISEYFRLVESAKAITSDTTERYAAFAEAEAFLIEHALVVPYGTEVPGFVVSRLDPWEAQYASFGVSNLRYKGQKIQDHYVTMEEYESSASQH